jgi:hypothetical protein
MSPPPNNILFTQKTQATLDEQINFFLLQPPSQNTFTNTTTKTNEAKTPPEKVYEIYEKQILKLDKKTIKEPVFKDLKKTTQIANFANHLITHLKNIPQHEELILFYFLQTAISYIIKFCSPEECNLDELIFLAIILNKNTTIEECEDSLFDLIIKDDLEKNDGPGLLHINLYYNRFCKNKTEDSAEIILKHIIKIAKNYKPYKPQD